MFVCFSVLRVGFQRQRTTAFISTVKEPVCCAMNVNTQPYLLSTI